MTLEDFTTYTEVDTGNHITVNSATDVNFQNWAKDVAYLYKDKGSEYFGSNFIHLLDLKIHTNPDGGGWGTPWSLTNDIGDARVLALGNKTLICIVVPGSYNPPGFYLVEEVTDSGEYSSDWIELAYDTWYYLKIIKQGTNLTVYVYTDSARTTLLTHKTLTLHGDWLFQYIYGSQSWSTGANYTCTNMDIDNLILDGTVSAPSVTTVAAKKTNTRATLNGNVTVSEGTVLERGFDWGTVSETYTGHWTEEGSFGEGVFSHLIESLDSGETYYFRAKARNSAGWAYGSELSFTTTATSLTGKIFAFGYQNLFRVTESSFEKETELNLGAAFDSMIHDGTYLWIADATSTVQQIDPTGDMIVVSTHTYAWTNIYDIAQYGDYLYLAINDGALKFAKVTKADYTSSTLAASAIDGDNCTALSEISINSATDIYFSGAVGAELKGAIWKVPISTFTISSSQKYTGSPSKYFEDFKNQTNYPAGSYDSNISIPHHNYLDFHALYEEDNNILQRSIGTIPKDFTHKFKTSIQSGTFYTPPTEETDLFAFVWVLSAGPVEGYPGDVRTIHCGYGDPYGPSFYDCIALRAGKYFDGEETTIYYFALHEENLGGSPLLGTRFTATLGTDYYVKIVKSGTSLIAHFYTDPAYTTEAGTSVLTLQKTFEDDDTGNSTFTFYSGPSVWGLCNFGSCSYDGSLGTLDLKVENMDLKATTPATTGKIETFYVDTYIYAITDYGLLLRIVKSDLSQESSTEVKPGISFGEVAVHSPVRKLFFKTGTNANDIYWATTCWANHILKIRAGVWGIEMELNDENIGIPFSSSAGQGAKFYIGLASGNPTIKRVNVADMSIDSTLVLSTEISGEVSAILCT